MSVLELRPVAFTLHTRDKEDDYRWLHLQGDAKLFDRTKSLQKAAISDMGRGKPATFGLVEQDGRVAIIVANLETTRVDHSSTRVNDTLFLEFGRRDRRDVYHLCVGLLGKKSAEIQATLLGFAEAIFEASSSKNQFELSPLKMDSDGRDVSQAGNFVGLATALHATDESVETASRHLAFLAENVLQSGESFCFVMAGLTGLDKLAQVAKAFDSFLGLSRSKSIPTDEQTDLVSIVEKKKSWGNSSNDPVLWSLAFCVMGSLAVLVPLVTYRQTTSHGSTQETPSLTQTTRDSNEKTQISEPKQNTSANNLKTTDTNRDTSSEETSSNDVSLVLNGDRRLVDSSNSGAMQRVDIAIAPDDPLVVPVVVVSNGEMQLSLLLGFATTTNFKLEIRDETKVQALISFKNVEVGNDHGLAVSFLKPGNVDDPEDTLNVLLDAAAKTELNLQLESSNRGIRIDVNSQVLKRSGDYSIGDKGQLKLEAELGTVILRNLRLTVERMDLKLERKDED